MRGWSVLLLLLCLSCSRPQGGSLEVERMSDNAFPLSPSGITRDSTAFTLLYPFYSQDCLCTSYPRLLCREGRAAFLNGTSLERIHGAYDLGGAVREGENLLELRCGEVPEDAALIGEFGVWPAQDGGWCVGKSRPLELGSLVSQGLPFYTGTVAYRRQYELPEKVGRRWLRLSGWKGSACELWVNYRKVADIRSERMKMEVGPYLQPGLNEIELRIAGWPASSIPGDFGLFGDFSLK